MANKISKLRTILETYMNEKNTLIEESYGEVLVPEEQICLSGFDYTDLMVVLSDFREYVYTHKPKGLAARLSAKNCPYCSKYHSSDEANSCRGCPMYVAGNGCLGDDNDSTYARVLFVSEWEPSLEATFDVNKALLMLVKKAIIEMDEINGIY
ncbi:hypothetical protein JHD46_05410 [Sulfurimonas sp. SAG-AH-194-C20]|nr:hypothetical protein [Sulfurimonas sp. SAG-AH-194-C20]MDF1879077.1 hypothetical protein [Sulfurimonas sp. SAG-AH-194-C20]